jgi:hypothetical protein
MKVLRECTAMAWQRQCSGGGLAGRSSKYAGFFRFRIARLVV